MLLLCNKPSSLFFTIIRFQLLIDLHLPNAVYEDYQAKLHDLQRQVAKLTELSDQMSKTSRSTKTADCITSSDQKTCIITSGLSLACQIQALELKISELHQYKPEAPSAELNKV
ncbi:unnamed protein product [Protopolystoma xenopodis]|uniref:Uncharacterized protein n=1 Tax=Protopolystoma xenopodis TaxID=117903 RepID=A0A3S5ANP0_9PLAT|nr:unnamed protein product [Protopolystoma xenopodis]